MIALLSTGSNARGQLASGDFEDLNKFSAAGLPNDVTILSIATGSNHTLILAEIATATGLQRQLWGAGDGLSGQLGPGYREAQRLHGRLGQAQFCRISLPLQTFGLENYTPKFVSATWETSYVVLSFNGVHDVIISMGSNDFGDLGTGKTDKQKCTGIHVVSFCHLSSLNGTSLSNGTFLVKKISTGQRHVIALIEILGRVNAAVKEELLVGWGSARHGQLGPQTGSNGSASPPPPYVPLPSLITIPQSGLPQNETIEMMALGMHHSVFLTTTGHLIPIGSNRKNQLDLCFSPPPGKIMEIDATWNGTYAVVKNDNVLAIYSSGSNSHGQLGQGSIGQKITGVNLVTLPSALGTQISSIQINCGTEHVLALLTRHPLDDQSQPLQELWAWGWNEHGNLGTGTTSDADIPIQVWSSTQQPTGDQLSSVQSINGIWAGSGTSWISCQVRGTPEEP